MPQNSTILIVDDEPDICETLENLLSLQGYNLAFANSGSEALARAGELTPDLILLDVMMPTMDGFEVCRRLRADPLLAEVPIIIITALANAESRLRGIKAGADDFLPKPFDPAELLARVRTITQLNRYRRLHMERAKFKRVIELSPNGIMIVDALGKVRLASPTMLRLLGVECEEDIVDTKMLTFVEPTHRKHCAAFLDVVIKTAPTVASRETLFVRLDGKSFPVEMDAGYFEWDGQPAAQIVVRDITERKRAEEALRRERDMTQKYLDVTSVILVALNEKGEITLMNRTGHNILGYKEGELEDKNWFDTCLPVHAREKTKHFFQQLMAGQIESYKTYENSILTKSGEERTVAWHNTVIRDETGRISGTLASGEDITERKRAQEQVQRQLQRLATLRNIDLAITASLDLKTILNVFLDQVTRRLHLDAATVLLLNPRTQTLEYAAGRGFRMKAIVNPPLRLGVSYAGRAALQRRIISVPDLLQAKEDYERARRLEEEGFISYYAAPLIAKGQVKGILEIFHRATLDPEPEWLEFLEALAAQAAIAIDNAELFDSLQRANAELSQAYDATLEGWSRALELRDKETKDHTRRVTEMTLRLSRAMGLSNEELVHIRRGALLHDIGKMAIPDGILLKPGPLTEAEEEIMRKHPIYANEMLSLIPYLRPALDIPYCHHEKWDGTGYPRGLKGEQIPLAARIFAVVDVWDALRSDRPYRPGWPKEKARAYIRAQAGEHFDPRVAITFLELEW